MTWQELALCAGASAFHDPSPDGVEAALALCNGRPCPVRRQCHDWADKEPGGYEGVAGGRLWMNGRPIRPPRPVRMYPTGADPELLAAHATFVRTPKDERSEALTELEAQYQAARYQIRKTRRAAA